MVSRYVLATYIAIYREIDMSIGIHIDIATAIDICIDVDIDIDIDIDVVVYIYMTTDVHFKSLLSQSLLANRPHLSQSSLKTFHSYNNCLRFCCNFSTLIKHNQDFSVEEINDPIKILLINNQ